jgi:voltage-gated sodium channel
VRPIMEKYPYAWLFFIPFIIGTTFTILNLFIGIIVNAIQSEHDKEQAAEREAERQAVRQEAEPLAMEIRSLREKVETLQSELLRRLPGAT